MQIDNAEDLDVLIPWIEQKIQKKQQAVCRNVRVEPSNHLSSNSESFKYKTSITRNTYNLCGGETVFDADRVAKNKSEIFVPLEHLSNFCRTLKIPLNNCDTE